MSDFPTAPTVQPLPYVGVAHDKFILGVNNIDAMDGVEMLTVLRLDEALCRKWHTDAHFVTYVPTHIPEEAAGQAPTFARVNTPALAQLRARGIDLERTMMVLDIDNPEHKPWGETTTKADFEQRFAAMCNAFPVAWNFCAMYYTQNGARVIYVLDETIPVDVSVARKRWFLTQIRSHGIECDMLVDWGRVFRLPQVMRDRTPTWEQPYYAMEVDWDARLPGALLGEMGEHEKAHNYLNVKPFDYPMPDFDDARKLVEVMQDGAPKMTDWGARAKRRLKHRDCWDCLFDYAPLASQGSRDNTIHSYAGQAVSMLYQMEGTTPDHIFGLFLPAVQGLDQLPGDADWTSVLWSAIGRLWSKEEAKVEARRLEIADRQKDSQEAADNIVAGMRQWCAVPGLYQTEEAAREVAESMFIACHDSDYYLVDNEGYYRAQTYKANHLIPAIRDHLPGLIPLNVPKADGSGFRPIKVDELIRRYCTIVSKVRYEPGRSKGVLINATETTATLVLPSYHRSSKLSPQYDSDVDEWLRMFFGNHYQDGVRWIAYALAFEEGPTCALSIEGPPSIGKKMLVMGLAECLEYPCVATDADMTGQWNYALLDTPFLSVNEGWTRTVGGKDPADKFREITSGDPMTVNRKGKAPIEVRNPVRVIFTANNLEVIRCLAKDRDLSQSDRDALAIRLMHMELSTQASRWLKARGGLRFTGSDGRRWIAPDSGGDSDHIVARHFLWLHANREQLGAKGDRLLVEGHGSSELMHDLQTKGGMTSLVIETLLSMVEQAGTIDGLIYDEQRHGIYVVNKAILSHWRLKMMQRIRGRDLTTASISSSLSGLRLDGSVTHPREIRGYEAAGKRRWTQLDPSKLYRVAEEYGIPCPKLEAVYRRASEVDREDRQGYGEAIPSKQPRTPETGREGNG